jgi:hypothetical protein
VASPPLNNGVCIYLTKNIIEGRSEQSEMPSYKSKGVNYQNLIIFYFI